MFYTDGTATVIIGEDTKYMAHYKVRKGNYSLKPGVSRGTWNEHEIWWRTP